MSDLRNRYFKTLGIAETDAIRRRRALNRAYVLRTFEIEHYWKRATYFWGFQIAIFAAFGLLWKAHDPPPESITLALAILGALTAVANRLSAAGSKFWQENWERHIDMLEDEFEGRLYKTVWVPNRKLSFSVSRINMALGTIFVFFWLFVTFCVGYHIIEPSLGDAICPKKPFEFFCNITNTEGVAVAIALLLFWIVRLYCQKTRIPSSWPNADGTHGAAFDCARAKQDFVSRYAPDEPDNKV